MDHGHLSMVADKFQWVFSEALLNACGKEAKLCRRQRVITPFRLGLALTATCASQQVETIADFHCGFNALFGTTITYKAFYNPTATFRFDLSPAAWYFPPAYPVDHQEAPYVTSLSDRRRRLCHPYV